MGSTFLCDGLWYIAGERGNQKPDKPPECGCRELAAGGSVADPYANKGCIRPTMDQITP
ncbi:MAG TPA: hypothetical protein VEI50_12990 [Nitrospiraceae bacterium]|nr:hypothetical protein [Nitrospiraceae bacterium]